MGKLRSVFYFSVFVLCSAMLSVRAQTDVAASVYGAFNSSSSGNGTTQNPFNAAGVLLELRHIKNPFVGFEATYSYNRANQNYSMEIFPPECSNPPCEYVETTSVPANAHEITGDWVASLKVGKLRPFAQVGGGLLLTVPSTGTSREMFCDILHAICQTTFTSIPTHTQTTGVIVYGAGLDWTIFPHLGLRFQYRGNLYKAPALTQAFTSVDSFTHNSEPMIGAFFQF